MPSLNLLETAIRLLMAASLCSRLASVLVRPHLESLWRVWPLGCDSFLCRHKPNLDMSEDTSYTGIDILQTLWVLKPRKTFLQLLQHNFDGKQTTLGHVGLVKLQPALLALCTRA